jgi:hypothetical protein
MGGVGGGDGGWRKGGGQQHCHLEHLGQHGIGDVAPHLELVLAAAGAGGVDTVFAMRFWCVVGVQGTMQMVGGVGVELLTA